MLPDAEAAASCREPRSRLLDRSSFPISTKRENQRHLSVNCDGEIVGDDGRRPRTAGRPSVVGPEGGGFEEFRAKLLVYLREAADRLNLIVPPIRGDPLSGPQPEPALVPGPEPSSSAAESADRKRRQGVSIRSDRRVSPSPPPKRRNRTSTKTVIEKFVGGVPKEPQPVSTTAPSPEPASSTAEAMGLWNLRRRRRGPSRVPIPIDCHVRLSPVAERSSARARRDSERRERPRFSITLTPEEIAEDMYAVTGSLPRRRPRKRARALQRQLDALLPGSWLSEVTADSYKVPD